MAGLLKSRYPLPFEGVRSDLDRWFDQFFSPERNVRNGGEQTWQAPASLWEDEDFFYLELEVPGVPQDDVHVTFEKGNLLVAAERHVPEGDRKYWHNDRSYGKLQMSVRIPDSVDGESIDAELKHGVLRLKLAKRPEAQPKKIAVKVTE